MQVNMTNFGVEKKSIAKKLGFGSSLTTRTQEYLIKNALNVGEGTKDIIRGLKNDGLNTLDIDLLKGGKYYYFKFADSRYPGVDHIVESRPVRGGSEVFVDIDSAFRNLNLLNLNDVIPKLKRERISLTEETGRNNLINKFLAGNFVENSSRRYKDEHLKRLSNAALLNLNKLAKNKELTEKCGIEYSFNQGLVILHSKKEPQISTIIFNAKETDHKRSSEFISKLTPEEISSYMDKAIFDYNTKQKLAKDQKQTVINLFS